MTDSSRSATQEMHGGILGPRVAVVVLAAGQGNRMRSRTHKVLHRVAGRPLIERVLSLAIAAGATEPVVVLGHLAEQVRAVLPRSARTVIQQPQLGTGHAIMMAALELQSLDADAVLVLYGDMALIRQASLQRLLAEPIREDHPIALLTATVHEPRGYGRVVRSPNGDVHAIVEEAEARESDRAIKEVHSGVMLVWAGWLWQQLHRLPVRPNGEYYLPDLVGIARSEGLSVTAVVVEDEDEVHGVNDRAQLTRANQIIWQRKRAALMSAGVTLLDPSSTFIDPEVQVEADVVIHAGCHLTGETSIAAGCEIGPNAVIADSRIGPNSRVWLSVVEQFSSTGERVEIGPFSHVRGRTQLGNGVALGNYAEVNRSQIGAGTKQHHVSYLGDAMVGEQVNIGAGSITANYDGAGKHSTTIGDRAFIGTNSTLRAPVAVGEDAFVGSGAVVTHDVPAGETWVGVPAHRIERQSTSPGGSAVDGRQ